MKRANGFDRHEHGLFLPPPVSRDLRRSGLTATDARAAGIFVPPLNGYGGKARYRLPYHDLDGKPVKFYRDRFVAKHLPTDRKGRPQRYTQPPESPPQFYLPKAAGIEWRKIAGDPKRELVICEGEKKSLAACKAGIATIGLGGVWSWKCKGHAIRDFDWFNWRGRVVRIVFDSDVHSNPDVQEARGALTSELLRRGAIPIKVDLPRLEGQDKTGLDDFIVSEGEQPFRKLLEGRASDERIEGAALLDDVFQFLGRFISYPSPESQSAHALWIAHTHLMQVWDSTPRIAFLAPERATGKTRALEITETLVPRPVNVMNVSVSYIFRRISGADGLPTILIDEIDTVWGPQANGNEEIRGLVNAGHRRGAYIGRAVARGDTFVTEDWPVYCALGLAGIGNLPDTVLSRSVVIRMRRRAANEPIEPYRARYHAGEGNALRDQLAAWAEQIAPNVGNEPELPPEIIDRDADVWESLLAVADAAGGAWPGRARVAAVALVAQLKTTEGQSLGIRLLADLKRHFGTNQALPTQSILDALTKDDEAPWGDLKGKPLDARRLARLLKPYGIESKVIRVRTSTPRGYQREDLIDAWNRYLPKPPKLTRLRLKNRKDLPTADGFHLSTRSATNATSATGSQP